MQVSLQVQHVSEKAAPSELTAWVFFQCESCSAHLSALLRRMIYYNLTEHVRGLFYVLSCL